MICPKEPSKSFDRATSRLRSEKRREEEGRGVGLSFTEGGWEQRERKEGRGGFALTECAPGSMAAAHAGPAARQTTGAFACCCGIDGK